MLNSPAPASPLRHTYLDTPPLNETIELPPREPAVQYTQAKSSPIDPSHLSPIPPDTRQNLSTSPQPSFYSASDIPPSSPLPSPKYLYPNGEVTSTPPSRRTSVATSRAVSMSGRAPPLQPQEPIPFQPTLLLPSSPTEESEAYEASAYEPIAVQPTAYEPATYDSNANDKHQYQQQHYAMNTLAPLSPGPVPFTPPSASFPPSSYQPDMRAPSQASYATYATGADGYWTADEGSNVGHSQQPQIHPLQPQHQLAMLGANLGEEEYNDRDTISRRLSAVSGISTTTSTWEGGRAL